MKERLDLIMKALTIAFFSFFVVGGVVVLRYCLSINYYPKGVSITDGIFFICVAIVFLMYFMFFSLVHFSIGLLVYKSIRSFINFSMRFLPREKPSHLIDIAKEYKTVLIFGAISILSLPIFYFYNQFIATDIIQSSFSSLVLIVFLHFCTPKNSALISTPLTDLNSEEGDNKVRVKILFLSLIVFCPLIITSALFNLSVMTMKNIGIASENVNVMVSNEVCNILAQGCSDTGYSEVKNVTVLWSAVGQGTVIQLPNEERTIYVLNDDDVYRSYSVRGAE